MKHVANLMLLEERNYWQLVQLQEERKSEKVHFSQQYHYLVKTS